MSESERGREEWEYADGPTVGADVPITSEPREEEQPGVPVEPETADRPKGAEREDGEGEGQGEDSDTPPGTESHPR